MVTFDGKDKKQKIRKKYIKIILFIIIIMILISASIYYIYTYQRLSFEPMNYRYELGSDDELIVDLRDTVIKSNTFEDEIKPGARGKFDITIANCSDKIELVGMYDQYLYYRKPNRNIFYVRRY